MNMMHLMKGTMEFMQVKINGKLKMKWVMKNSKTLDVVGIMRYRKVKH